MAHLVGRSLVLASDREDRHIHKVTSKKKVLSVVQQLPDDSSIDDIADRIDFVAGVQRGLDELDSGDGISHAKVKKELASWLSD